MIVKKNPTSNKKEGEITRQERTSVNFQAESALKSIKESTGDVILVPISSRTTIELPAHLTQEERDARVANYVRLHGIKI